MTKDELMELADRLEQTAHDFEMHDPAKGVTYLGRCDTAAILKAAELIRASLTEKG